jgi:hypothetical protein
MSATLLDRASSDSAIQAVAEGPAVYSARILPPICLANKPSDSSRASPRIPARLDHKREARLTFKPKLVVF